MLRCLYSLISVVFLLLSVAAGVLGWRSSRAIAGQEDRISWVGGDGRRHTVRSEGGRFTWHAAPRANLAARPTHRLRTSADIQAAYRASAGGMTWDAALAATRGPAATTDRGVGTAINRLRSTDAMAKVIYVAGKDGRTQVDTIFPSRKDDSAAERLAPYTLLLPGDCVDDVGSDPAPYPATDLSAALLPLLEDPDRFAIAHLLLCENHVGAGLPETQHWLHADGSATGTYAGLRYRIALPPPPPDLLYGKWVTLEAPARFDPDSLPTVREFWHRRLDVEVGSASWPVTAGGLVLPAVVQIGAMAWMRRRRRSRRSRGLCVACGYNLRCSPSRCPECGRDTGPSTPP